LDLYGKRPVNPGGKSNNSCLIIERKKERLLGHFKSMLLGAGIYVRRGGVDTPKRKSG